LFKVTTNPQAIRGEGLGMAALAGAEIADPEFVQFHPTAIDVGKDPAPLATEALRGEGATLLNSKGERFMTGLHADAELAPRDVVTRGNFAQIQAGEKVFLDTRDVVGAKFEEKFPTVYGYCKEAGIDPVTDTIPVVPAQHYHMGGILTDENGKTSLPGLWAVGEVTSTGAHGANRLASNSLLEATVFGHRAAEDFLRADLAPAIAHTPKPSLKMDRAAAERCLPHLRQTMTDQAGVIRNGNGLRSAIRDIAILEAEAGYTAPFINMATTAKLIVTAALLRTESRGGHYRTDYPDTDPEQAERTFFDIRQMRAVEETVLDAHAEEAIGT
jgi:L-aspartate oxidase